MLLNRRTLLGSPLVTGLKATGSVLALRFAPNRFAMKAPTVFLITNQP